MSFIVRDRPEWTEGGKPAPSVLVRRDGAYLAIPYPDVLAIADALVDTYEQLDSTTNN